MRTRAYADQRVGECSFTRRGRQCVFARPARFERASSGKPDACEPASAAVLLFFVMLGFQLVSPARDSDAPVNTVQFAVLPTRDILLDQTPPMSAVIYAQLDDKNSAPGVEIQVLAATTGNGAGGCRGRPLPRLFSAPRRVRRSQLV